MLKKINYSIFNVTLSRNHWDFIINYFTFVMSTLAAARADNFYRPKNFDPTKVVPRKSDNP
jgi:hypothetical protein